MLNNGLGPAILKKFHVFFDGEKIGDSHNRAALENKIEDILNQQPGIIIRHTISVMGLNFPVPAGYQETLLEIQVLMTFQLDKKFIKAFWTSSMLNLSISRCMDSVFLYYTYSREALKS